MCSTDVPVRVDRESRYLDHDQHGDGDPGVRRKRRSAAASSPACPSSSGRRCCSSLSSGDVSASHRLPASDYNIGCVLIFISKSSSGERSFAVHHIFCNHLNGGAPTAVTT